MRLAKWTMSLGLRIGITASRSSRITSLLVLDTVIFSIAAGIFPFLLFFSFQFDNNNNSKNSHSQTRIKRSAHVRLPIQTRKSIFLFPYKEGFFSLRERERENTRNLNVATCKQLRMPSLINTSKARLLQINLTSQFFCIY